MGREIRRKRKDGAIKKILPGILLELFSSLRVTIEQADNDGDLQRGASPEHWHHGGQTLPGIIIHSETKLQPPE